MRTFFFLFLALWLASCASLHLKGDITGKIGDVEYAARATGRTSMHGLDLCILNTSSEEAIFSLEPGIFTAGPDYQPLITTEPVTVTVPPKMEVTVPGPFVLCIDISKPAPPAGTLLSYMGPDDFGPSIAPGTDLSSIPGFTLREEPMSVVPKIPGLEYPLDYTVDIDNHLANAAPLLMVAATRLRETYDEMKEAGEIQTPLPPEAVDESVLQQTYWSVTSALTGNEYKKTDLEENLKKDYEKKTGQPLDLAPVAVQEDFRQGATQLWDNTFMPLAERARLLNPAYLWDGVDQKVWIETGPEGGSFTLPDGAASLTLFPSPNDRVTGTFFSRNYDIPGLRSFGFTPSEVVYDMPAPRLSLPPFGGDATTGLRTGRDSVFFPIPAPGAGESISLPPGPAEILLNTSSEPCVVPPEALVPPPAPEGYEYVGREVVVNFAYETSLSTVPLDRPHHKDDLIFLKSNTIVKDHVTVCDWIVTHVFQKK